MILDNIKTSLWPHPVPRPSGEFNQHDNEEAFKKNLKELGSSWHYANKPIYYQNNSIGYRTKELEYYKDKDFVLVMGCSHTEGVGQADDETWHSHITKEYGLEVLNAGFCASGPDIQLFNTMLFLKQKELCPRAVVIQWPHLSRVMFKGDSIKRLLVPNLNMDLDSVNNKSSFFERFKREQRVAETFYKWWLYDNNDQNSSWIFVEVTRMMWKLANVPYYDFTINNDDPDNIDERFDNLRKQISEIDYARDLSHYGPKFNKEVGKIVCDKLKSML